jgi:hypothetical protein
MRDTFRAAYRAQLAALPGAEVVFAETARHFVMLDDPGFFFATLEGFLEQAPDPGRSSSSEGADQEPAGATGER